MRASSALVLAALLGCGSGKSKSSEPPEPRSEPRVAGLNCGPLSEPSPARRPDESPLWVAIVAPALREAISPLADHRRNRGFEVVVSSGDPGVELAKLDLGPTDSRARVNTAAPQLERRPSYILLVGDEVAAGAAGAMPWRVASKWRPLYRWRSAQREQFAADALWGDVDDDLVPDVPVGRLPARTVAELEVMVAKIITYEKAPASRAWLNMPLWVGAAGYNPQLDSMAMTMLLGMLESQAPGWARWSLLSGDPAHPLSAWPARQAALYSKALASGGAMAFLMGHGSTTSFHSMMHAGASIDYTTGDAAALGGGQPAPPLVIFTCESGNFTAAQASLAEALIGASGGPVATIAATTESHPLTNYFSAESMLVGLARGGRLGDLWLDAQRRASTASNVLIEHALAEVEGKLEDEIDVAQLRRDQLLMYAIIGDPATPLRLPAGLDVDVEPGDGGCQWSVTPPPGATALYVDYRPDAVAVASVAAAADEPSAMERYRQADAGFAFTALDELAAGVPWRGLVTQPGRVRLTAIGGEHIWARTFSVTR